MTDPLARIEAMIETLGSREARFWTPLDTSQEQVSNPEALKNAALDGLDSLDTPQGTLSVTISSGSMKTHPTVTQKHRKSRARRVLFRELSKLSKVSKTNKKIS